MRSSAPLILIRILATAATADKLKVRPSACALARWPSFVAFVILLNTTIASFPLLHKILESASPFSVRLACRYFPVSQFGCALPCPALACHIWVRVRVHVLIFRRLFRSRIDFAVGPGNEFRASPIHLRTGPRAISTTILHSIPQISSSLLFSSFVSLSFSIAPPQSLPPLPHRGCNQTANAHFQAPSSYFIQLSYATAVVRTAEKTRSRQPLVFTIPSLTWLLDQ